MRINIFAFFIMINKFSYPFYLLRSFVKHSFLWAIWLMFFSLFSVVLVAQQEPVQNECDSLEPEMREALDKHFALTGQKEMFEKSMFAGLESQLSVDRFPPQMRDKAPEIIEEVRKFARENLTWDMIESVLCKQYSLNHTLEEIQEINDIFSRQEVQEYFEKNRSFQGDIMKETSAMVVNLRPKIMEVIKNVVSKHFENENTPKQ